ncbi:iron complex outermembrane receptor protein [Ensifer sp. KUDG1]|uniref:TonB-dependent siderophore receptor n=1 Tax=Ensifer sp. KUDG1 TaxID=3373919 RepID=UPI003D1B1762
MMNGNRPQRTAKAAIKRMLATTAFLALAGVVAGTPAAAQQPNQSYAIASGSLDTALSRFGATSGVQVLYSAAITKGRTSSGANGALSADAALARILAGTGLTYRFTGPKSVTISDPAAPASAEVDANGATKLQAIVATGEASENSYVVADSSTGTKTDAPLIEIPQSISVVGRKQIEAQNAQSVTEILRYVPGVTIETYGPDPKGYDWIMMRGFNAQSTSSYRDGLRQLSSGYTFFRTDPYQLETVEVLRGPSSSLYGQSDAGGIVNRVSKKPTTDRRNEVEVEYGSFSRMQGAFDLSGPIGEDPALLYRVIGVARNSDTQFTYGNGADIGDDRLLLAPSLTFAPDAETSLTISGDLLQDKSGGSAISFTPTGVLIGDPSFNRSEQIQKTIGYEFEHRLNETWTVRQNVRYGHVNFLLDNLLISGSGSAGLNRVARRFDESFDGLAIDNQAQAEFDTGSIAHDLLLGLDYAWSRSDVRHYTGPAPSLNPFNPVYGLPVTPPGTPLQSYKERYQQIGVYAQDQISLTDSLIATLGGRYDWLDLDNTNRLRGTKTEIDVGHFSGRAGLTYLTDWGVAPYVSFSQSFVPNSGVSADGDTFDPSEGRQWEVGVKYEPTSFDGLFTLAYFDIVKSNVLTPDTRPGNTGFSVATGEVQSRGLELEGKFSLGSGWDFTGSYTWTDAEITKDNSGNIGNRPALVPEHQASAWLNYTVTGGTLEGLSLGGGARFVGSSFGNNTNTLEVGGRTVFDLGASYKVTENATLSLNATNVFDKKYYTTCNPAYSCYEGDRRSVIGRLKIGF